MPASMGAAGNGKYSVPSVQHASSADHRYFHGIVSRFSSGGKVSELGCSQALNGQVVSDPSDRAALAELLRLIAEPSVAHLLLPAVQKIRDPPRR